MNTEILTAVTGKRVLSFLYNEKERNAAPHAYGLSRKGEEIIRAWETDTEVWKLFIVSKMLDVQWSGDRFDTAPGYRQGDSAMTTIHAEVRSI